MIRFLDVSIRNTDHCSYHNWISKPLPLLNRVLKADAKWFSLIMTLNQDRHRPLEVRSVRHSFPGFIDNSVSETRSIQYQKCGVEPLNVSGFFNPWNTILSITATSSDVTNWFSVNTPSFLPASLTRCVRASISVSLSRFASSVYDENSFYVKGYVLIMKKMIFLEWYTAIWTRR